MLLISNPVVREQIETSLDKVARLIPELSQQDISLEQVDAFCQILIAENRKSAIDEVSAKLDYELSIAYYDALSVGLMSLAVEEKISPVIEPDWIDTNSTPEPNLIFSKMLVNIANSVLGVVHLVEHGLEAQARTNLRMLLELSWLTLIIIAKRDKMTSHLTVSALHARLTRILARNGRQQACFMAT